MKSEGAPIHWSAMEPIDRNETAVHRKGAVARLSVHNSSWRPPGQQRPTDFHRQVKNPRKMFKKSAKNQLKSVQLPVGLHQIVILFVFSSIITASHAHTNTGNRIQKFKKKKYYSLLNFAFFCLFFSIIFNWPEKHSFGTKKCQCFKLKNFILYYICLAYLKLWFVFLYIFS